MASKNLKTIFKGISRRILDKAEFLSAEPPVVRAPYALPELPPGVVPKGTQTLLAMDDAGGQFNSWANNLQLASFGLTFPGYAYLSELAQLAEYRAPAETTADEMTRKWIELRGSEDGDHEERINELNKALVDFGVREICRRAIEQDEYFGRSQIFINIKGDENSRNNPLNMDVDSNGAALKDRLLGFKVIEPIWTTPSVYNSNDPTQPDFYKPSSWYIMGVQTHNTRLLTIIGREVPDLLKPSYNFGGVSMSQLMEPYVKNWLKTRQAVNEIIYSFSTTVLATDMAATMAEDEGEGLFKRVKLFSRMRGNQGVMVINKDTEELGQNNTPLSSLDKLQAQAQEHMSAPCHIPQVKLLGLTPGGLNASSEGEIKVFYDFIHSQQEARLRVPVTVIINLLQLHLYGDIDEGITFDFVPLDQMTEKELSEVRKANADAATAYTNLGAIDADEVRQGLIHDPESGYNDLTGPAPGPPELDEADHAHELGEESADNAASRTEKAAQSQHKRDKQLNKGKPK